MLKDWGMDMEKSESKNFIKFIPIDILSIRPFYKRDNATPFGLDGNVGLPVPVGGGFGYKAITRFHPSDSTKARALEKGESG
mmetsp:Transcript_66250/g.149559  ORF Transcript_66250/g.149559 Transcript_66250/m.149559 type:complete len:82 (+) Transcript_66250:604-849(+)